jgi:hypothetical protein
MVLILAYLERAIAPFCFQEAWYGRTILGTAFLTITPLYEQQRESSPVLPSPASAVGCKTSLCPSRHIY